VGVAQGYISGVHFQAFKISVFSTLNIITKKIFASQGDRRKGPLPKYAPGQMFGKKTCEAVSPMSVWFPHKGRLSPNNHGAPPILTSPSFPPLPYPRKQFLDIVYTILCIFACFQLILETGRQE